MLSLAARSLDGLFRQHLVRVENSFRIENLFHMSHILYHLLRFTMSKIICLQETDTVFCADTSTFVLHIIEHEGLQLSLDLFGCVKVVETLHNSVQVKVAISNVTMTEHTSSKTSHSGHSCLDDLVEVS